MTEVRSKFAVGERTFTAEIAVENLDGVLRSLKTVDPEVHKELRREFRDIAKTLEDRAQSRSGFSKDRYATRVGARESAAGFRVLTKDAPSSIFELAGLRNPHGSGKRTVKRNGRKIEVPSTQGATLIATLNSRYGSPYRILWPSWRALRAHAMERVQAAVGRAEETIQRRMDEAG